jgi:hypothetical protein
MDKIIVILYAAPILLGIFLLLYLLSRIQMRGWLQELDKYVELKLKTFKKESDEQRQKK